MSDVEARRLLDDLVAIDSTSGGDGETAVVMLVADWFARHAPATDVVQDADGLIAVPVGGSAEESALVFACHGDVVPVSDASAWSSAPFVVTERDGRLFGRGVSDMKSGLAAAAVAVARLHADGVPVVFTLSSGEEVGSIGAPVVADLLRRRSVRVGAFVVPESTGNVVRCGHRGALWLTVTTAGVAAHGSTPELGRNAIGAMADAVIAARTVPVRTHPSLGVESVNVGTIAGGTVPNIVPDQCVAQVDHRVVDGAARERLGAWWAAQRDVVSVDVRLDLAPVWTDPDDAWVRSLPAPVEAVPVSYFTDASVFVRLFPDAPVVVWGPGDPEAVHTVDESLPVGALEEATALFIAAGRAWPLAARRR